MLSARAVLYCSVVRVASRQPCPAPFACWEKLTELPTVTLQLLLRYVPVPQPGTNRSHSQTLTLRFRVPSCTFCSRPVQHHATVAVSDAGGDGGMGGGGDGGAGCFPLPSRTCRAVHVGMIGTCYGSHNTGGRLFGPRGCGGERAPRAQRTGR